MIRKSLLALLNKPRHYEAKERAWTRLTTGDELYRELEEAVKADGIGDALQLVTAWKSFAEYASDAARQQWETVYWLVWCAGRAVAQRSLQKVGQDAALTPSESGPPPSRSKWARVCTNALLTVTSRKVRLPIAGVDRHGNGFNAVFVAELLPGQGQVVHHPCDSFSVVVEPSFSDAMEEAWAAAQAMMQAEGADPSNFDGCWRVLDEYDRPVPELSGASAGGAAAVAWFQAFERHDTFPDDRVIIMAGVDLECRLTAVDDEGLRAKARAVANAGHVDTILVASADNQRAAEGALREAGAAGSIKVYVAETLRKASEARSQLTRSLIVYCNELLEELDKTDWYGPLGERVKISDIIMPVRLFRSGEYQEGEPEDNPAGVIDTGLSTPDEVSDLVEGSGKGNQFVDAPVLSAPPAADLPLVIHVDPYQSQLYEEGGVRGGKEVDWSEVWPPLYQETVVIKAAPGGGKTIQTRHAVVEAAALLISHLERRTVKLDEVANFPVWLPLIRMADADLPSDPASAIVAAVERHFVGLELTPSLREFIKERLRSGAWLFFDGLDELYLPEQIARVTSRFRSMRDWLSPRCVTCRAANYDPGVLVSDRVAEYELAPFRWNPAPGPKFEIEGFINKWFAPEPELAQDLLKILELNFAIHHQCRSPLLLTLTCLAHQSRAVTEKTTCADLFSRVVFDLLRGKWRGGAAGPDGGYDAFRLRDEGQQVEFARNLLPCVAYSLISKSPLRNSFLYGELLDAIDSAPPRWRPHGPQQAIEWLQTKGVLVKAGYEGVEPRYSFVHRALMEYLVAQELKNQPDYLETIRNGISDPDRSKAAAWGYILPPLVGLLEDPVPVISMLDDACHNDAYRESWGSFSLTLLTCLLECKSPVADEAVRARIFDTVLAHVDAEQRRLREKEWGTLEKPYELARIFAAVERHYGSRPADAAVRIVTNELQHAHGKLHPSQKSSYVGQINAASAIPSPAAPVRWAALRAQVALRRKGAASSVEAFLRDPNPVVRALAARALVTTDRDGAFEKLINMLREDPDTYACGSAAGALGRLGDRRALKYLKQYALAATEPRNIIRGPAMWALAQLAEPHSQELIPIFRAGLDDDDNVISSAINGLVKLNCSEVWHRLAFELEYSTSPAVRKQAAWALGKFGIVDAVGALVTATGDPDVGVAAKCYTAIMNYALDQAQPQVEAFIRQATGKQRRSIAFGWREAARRSQRHAVYNAGHYKVAAELCLMMTNDPSAEVRETACRTLITLAHLPALRHDAPLCKGAAARGLRLMEDEEPRVRMAACSLLTGLMRIGSPALVKDTRLIQAVTSLTLRLLDRDLQQVQASACTLLIELLMTAKVPTLMTNELLRYRVAKEGLRLLTNSSSLVRVRALKAFEALLSVPTPHGNEPLLREAAEHTLSLLADSAPRVRASALVTLKMLITKDEGLQDSVLTRWAIDRALSLTKDTDHNVRASACWFTAHMAKLRVPALADASPLAESSIQTLTALLMAEMYSPAKAYALRALHFLMQLGPRYSDGSLLRMLADRGLELLAGVSSNNVKANALSLLKQLLPLAVLRNNRPFHIRLAAQCLKLLDSLAVLADRDSAAKFQAEYVKLAALGNLGVLVETSALKTDEEFVGAVAERALALTYEANPLTRGQALALLVDMTKEQLSADARLSRAIVDRGLYLLNDPTAYARSLALILLQSAVLRHGDDEQLSRDMVERCLKLLADTEPEVKAAALRTMETMMTETSWGKKQEVGRNKEYMEQVLKVANDKSPKVRAAANGVLGVLADKESSRALVERNLRELDDTNPGVISSALVVLERMLTTTKLSQDKELNRRAVGKCLSLLDGTQLDSISPTVLRTLENILTRTVLFGDTEVGRETVEKILATADDTNAKTRGHAYGTLQALTKGKLPVLRRDQELTLKVAGKSLAILRGKEREAKASACHVLAGIASLNLKAFTSDMEITRGALDSGLDLLRDRNTQFQASAIRLLIEMLKASPEAVAEPRLARDIITQSTALLAVHDVRVRINAAELLGRMFNLNLQEHITRDKSLVAKICDLGLALLHDSEPAIVKANALVLLTLVIYLPKGRGRDAVAQDAVKKAVALLVSPDPQVRVSAANLLAIMIKGKMNALLSYPHLVSTVARRSLDLMSDEVPSARASACWMLTSMAWHKLPALVSDGELMKAIRERAEALLDDNSTGVRKNAQRLLQILARVRVPGVNGSQPLALS